MKGIGLFAVSIGLLQACATPKPIRIVAGVDSMKFHIAIPELFCSSRKGEFLNRGIRDKVLIPYLLTSFLVSRLLPFEDSSG